MKTFLIALLIPCLSFGQKKDSSGSTTNSALTNRTSLTPTWITATPAQPKYDTVKCVILCCDTSYLPGFFSLIYNNKHKDTAVYEPNRLIQVWWQFGFEIRSHYFLCCDPPTYLDENKKQLSKSIIVWMSREIKQ